MLHSSLCFCCSVFVSPHFWFSLHPMVRWSHHYLVSPKSWCPSTFPTLFPTMSLHVKLNFSTRRHGFSLPRLATFFLDLNLPAFRNVLIHPLHKCKFYHPFKRLFSKASGFSPPLEFHITSSVALGASLSPELSPFMIWDNYDYIHQHQSSITGRKKEPNAVGSFSSFKSTFWVSTMCRGGC